MISKNKKNWKGFKKKAYVWKRSRINPMSKKRRAESKIRNAQIPAFLEQHPLCEIRSPVCTGRTECRHHKKGRLGTLFLDPRFQVASCFMCNGYLETYEGRRWGKEREFVLQRLGK